MRLAVFHSKVESLSDLEHAVAQTSDADLRDRDCLVIRLSPDAWFSLVANKDATTKVLVSQKSLVRKRVKNLCIAVLPEMSQYSDGSKSDIISALVAPKILFPLDNVELFRDLTPDEFHILRSWDLGGLILDSRDRCVLRASAKHHFSLPSKAHASLFVRVAEALTDMSRVDAVAYWVALDIHRTAPLLDTRKPCLLVDNPSMLTVASRVAALCAFEIGVQSLKKYPTTAETIREVHRVLDDLCAKHKAIYVLISISATGGLVSLIENWIASSGVTEITVSVLYCVHEGNGAAMCCPALPGYELYGVDVECKLCQVGSTAVEINESTYFVGEQRVVTVALPPKFFRQQRDFISRYGQIDGVLRTHYDDPNEGRPRHHAFYVDVGTLLDNQEFLGEIRKKLSDLDPKPDLILAPRHPVAARLASIASEFLGVASYQIALPLSETPDDVKDALTRAECILVIDDLMITGSRLSQFNGSFREDHALCPKIKNICFLALIAIPSSSMEYQRSKDGLVSAHGWTSTLQHLHQIVLPPWHHPADCPWCIEERILSDLIESEELLESGLNSRLTMLANKRDGLTDLCFDRPAQTAVFPKFGDQSPILPAGSTGLQLAFSCASAVQQLREDPDKPLDSSGFPAPSLIAKRVFAKNYTEKLIWIAMLRSLRREEISEELAEFIRSEFTHAVRSNKDRFIVRELVIAALSGKVGQLYDDAQTTEVFECAGISIASAMASRYVRKRKEEAIVVKAEPTLRIGQKIALSFEKARAAYKCLSESFKRR